MVVAFYVLAAATSTYQRGIASRAHTTFAIFRQSFVHLVHGTNLYAYYPSEQGGTPNDLFKYSPSAAALFAPLTAFPYPVALFVWDLLNALLLCYAILRVIPGSRRAWLAAFLVVPQVHASVQASSSNALIAALILLAFDAIVHDRPARGACAVTVGSAMKIFPLAALSFVVFTSSRRKFVVTFLWAAITVVALPLLFTSLPVLVRQYHWWGNVLRTDAADVSFGVSAMSLLRRVIGGTWPPWPVQLTGTVLLLLPLALRHDAWPHQPFRHLFLASLLVYVVLFNHQSESPTYVIATTGAVLWYVEGPGTVFRTFLTAWLVLGGRAFPAVLVWCVLQFDLLHFEAEPCGYKDATAPPNVPSRISPRWSRVTVSRDTSARSSRSRANV